MRLIISEQLSGFGTWVAITKTRKQESAKPEKQDPLGGDLPGQAVPGHGSPETTNGGIGPEALICLPLRAGVPPRSKTIADRTLRPFDRLRMLRMLSPPWVAISESRTGQSPHPRPSAFIRG